MYRGFPTQLVSVLLCPEDGSPFSHTGDEEHIRNGILHCSECGMDCHIKEGIVHFLPLQDPSYAHTEARARDAEAPIYDSRLRPRYYREVIPTLRALGDCTGQKIIEYACGTGRLTREVTDGYESYLALDFSLESLFVLKDSLVSKKNIGLVWADAVQVKTSNNYFDTAFSSQFLEHIEHIEDQKTFLNNVRSTLNDNGVFVASVYYHDLRRRLKSMSQDGVHANGISYHYFSRDEIRTLFQDFFDNLTISFIDTLLPFEARLNLSHKIEGFISEVLRYIPFVRQFAHLLLIQAKNPHNEQ